VGGRDQEDYSSKPARASSSRDPISTIPIKGLVGVAQMVEYLPSKHEAEVKLWHGKKKKKKTPKNLIQACYRNFQTLLRD
jgi:hypothetical protein